MPDQIATAFLRAIAVQYGHVGISTIMDVMGDLDTQKALTYESLTAVLARLERAKTQHAQT
jgi:hypothetical protein